MERDWKQEEGLYYCEADWVAGLMFSNVIYHMHSFYISKYRYRYIYSQWGGLQRQNFFRGKSAYFPDPAKPLRLMNQLCNFKIL